MKESKSVFITYFIIVVAACGYFVDIYDLILFNVVKKESLEMIMKGSSLADIKDTGIFLFNMQMTGMLLGGLLWGVWGDKKGRISVLFGSILLYSAANLANAFITSIPAYAIIRVIAGIGLAGELGAGITLVSETMSKEKRGYGTMIIVSFGALGAVAAAMVGANGHIIGSWLGGILNMQIASWQVAYILGGVLGLCLLLLRVGTMESGMFKNIENHEVSKGDLTMLFTSSARFFKYLRCILVGLPIWFIIGLIVANSESIWAKELGVTGVVNGDALMYSYIGLCVGDIFSGILSQVWRSRRKVVITYLAVSAVLVVYYFFFARGISLTGFYLLNFLLGAATGFWALFVTIAAEQFGTNIRSTVTNTTPNFVRGSVPLIMGLFHWLTSATIGLNNVTGGFIVGLICLSLSFWAIIKSHETFAKDLDYTEQYP